jgi:hypothetical protein
MSATSEARDRKAFIHLFFFFFFFQSDIVINNYG